MYYGFTQEVPSGQKEQEVGVWSPLHEALVNNDRERASKLIENNEFVSCSAVLGLTPLHLAIDDASLVEKLLQKGADPNLRDHLGMTPLRRAVRGKHTESVRILLEGGAKPAADPEPGSTALHDAVQIGSKGICRLLLNHRWPADTEAGLGPLMIAARTGNRELVKLLIQKGARVTTGALGYACRAGRPEVVHLLLKNGAPVDGKIFGETSALHIAARSVELQRKASELPHFNKWMTGPWMTEHQRKVVKKLTGKPAEVLTPSSIAPQERAKGRNYAEVARLLIEHGAEVDVWSDRGFTPLHVAARIGNHEVVKILLSAGADPEVTTKALQKNSLPAPLRDKSDWDEGHPPAPQTPLEIAEAYGHSRIAETLREAR